LYEKPERLIVYRETRSFISRELFIMSVIIIPLFISYTYYFPKVMFLGYIVIMIEDIEYVSLILLIVQFTNIILLLRKRYKSLNRWLEFHSNAWRDSRKSSRKNILLLPDMDSYVLSYYNLKYERRQILDKRHIYSKLHEIVGLVNSYFGVPLLMLTFWVFIFVVYISYACVLSIMSGIHARRGLGAYIFPVSGFIWCAAFIGILLLVVLSCHTTTEECHKSQILIEKMLLRSGLAYETVNELRALSVQLNNMKVSFTACGFFSLDLPFMYNFVGVICTYIVILAQFE
jgi:hypothetical protein